MALNQYVQRDPTWAHLAANWMPIPKRPGYAAALAGTACVIALAVLMYVAIIVLVIWGVVWHMGEHADFAGSGRGRGAIATFIVYLAPAIIGGILVLMLIKPLFAPSAGSSGRLELKEFEELKLHTFVQNVCDVIGAPAPRRIEIDCDINASAGFRRGLVSVLSPGDMTLTIGLPLVAGMSKRQFAGVLAHEFGHFSQGTGMRASYIVSTVQNWMVRAAYEPDGWDERVTNALAQLGGWGGIIALACALCAWVVRLVLKGIVLVVSIVCTFMFKQMEFDADRYQIRLAGSPAFEPSFHRLADMSTAYGRVINECRVAMNRSHEVPENLPAMVADMARRLTPEARAEAREKMEREKVGLIATHPATKDRFAQARELNEPGLYTDEAPARELFGDFDGACVRATTRHWQLMFGPYFSSAKIKPNAEFGGAAGSGVSTENADALARYLGFEPPTWRPVFTALAKVPTVEDHKALVQSLKGARQEIGRLRDAGRVKADAYRRASEQIAKWESVRTILDAGLPVNFKALELPSTNRAGVSVKLDMLNTEATEAAMVMDEAVDAAAMRISAAVSLLGVPAIAKIVPDSAGKRARADALLAAMPTLKRLLPTVRKLRVLTDAIGAMGASVKNQQTFDAANKAAKEVANEARSLLDDARRVGGETPDPFGPGDRHANIGAAIASLSAVRHDASDVLDDAQLCVDRYTDLYRRTLGELVEIAEGVEKAVAAATKAKNPAPAA